MSLLILAQGLEWMHVAGIILGVFFLVLLFVLAQFFGLWLQAFMSNR